MAAIVSSTALLVVKDKPVLPSADGTRPMSTRFQAYAKVAEYTAPLSSSVFYYITHLNAPALASAIFFLIHICLSQLTVLADGGMGTSAKVASGFSLYLAMYW